ncbi:MAG TPA: ABC transporter ATP-binding protein [Bacteroidetes bacterium]|nr:ABC transporter ATP-binding protein [Bacteroidota bacterium]
MWHKNRLLKGFFTGHRPLLWLTLLVSLASGLLTIAVPVAIGKYYDFLFGYRSFRAKLLDYLPFDLNDIRTFLVFFLLLVVLKTVFAFFEKYCTSVLGEKLVYQTRGLLFQYQMKIPVRDYEDKGTGRYLLRFSGDLNSIKKYMTQGIVRFASDMVLLLMATALLFYLDPRLGLFMLLGLLLPLAGILAIKKKLSAATRKYRNLKSQLLAFTNTRLRGMQSVRLFNKEMPELAKFSRRADRILDAGIHYQKITSLINALVPGMLYLLLAALFAFIYFSGLNQSTATGSNILVFIILVLTIMPVMRRLLRVNIVWELGNISFEKLMNVLNRAGATDKQLHPFVYKKGEILIKDASYGFRSQNDIFDKLNLHIPGHGLALVKGGTGSGKTTIVKLISKLYRPVSGRVYIDGQDLEKTDGRSLRRRITVVSAEVPLLGKTVFEAISYSRKKEKRRAAQALLDYLQNNNPALPALSLDSPIGDLGCNLSKGQRKLLAYARAMLTNKKIFLIDEPFEGFSKGAIPFWAGEIKKLAKHKTVLVFAAQPVRKWLQPAHTFKLPEIKPAGGGLSSGTKKQGAVVLEGAAIA